MQFNFARKKAPQKAVRETVVPEPSYNIPLVLAGTEGILQLPPCRMRVPRLVPPAEYICSD